MKLVPSVAYSAEQLLVYQVVEKAGNKGIWHKDIRSQTSLQQPVRAWAGCGVCVCLRGDTPQILSYLADPHNDNNQTKPTPKQALKKILKNLESRQLIKSTSSISSKTRKLYLLYDLEPAKEITGGPW